MQLTAKLIECLPLKIGTSKNGEWKKQDIILETEGQYPKKVCVSVMGDNVEKFKNELKIGNLLEIRFHIESNQYNNKWYTTAKAWDINRIEAIL